MLIVNRGVNVVIVIVMCAVLSAAVTLSGPVPTMYYDVDEIVTLSGSEVSPRFPEYAGFGFRIQDGANVIYEAEGQEGRDAFEYLMPGFNIWIVSIDPENDDEEDIDEWSESPLDNMWMPIPDHAVWVVDDQGTIDYMGFHVVED